MSQPYYIHPSAYVDALCTIGAGTKIWHFCHVMSGARPHWTAMICRPAP